MNPVAGPSAESSMYGNGTDTSHLRRFSVNSAMNMDKEAASTSHSPLSEVEQDSLFRSVDDYIGQAELFAAKVLSWCESNRVNARRFSDAMVILRERVDHFSTLVADRLVVSYGLASDSMAENASRLVEFNGVVDKMTSGPAMGLPHLEWVQLRETIQVELAETKQPRKNSELPPENERRRRRDIRAYLRALYMRNHNTHETRPRDPEGGPHRLLECFIVPLVEIALEDMTFVPREDRRGGNVDGRRCELSPTYSRGW